MTSKKAIIISTAIIACMALVGLIPVFMYGFTVDGAEINMSLMISSAGLPSSSDDLGTNPDGWDAVWNAPPQVNERAINAYEYALSKMQGNLKTSEANSEIDVPVSIQITFNLLTPGGTSLSFTFEPTKLAGDGVKDIMVLLGPDELNGETGIFHLDITISIVVTLPEPLNTVVLEKTLTPVSLNFEIPSEIPA
ncbi:MAG: hypothetical protein JW776_12135 [Candidatus Lokiarchaeota archaeon]|nr:hypothetical protein [Candidatus Lokiarchaeota archaeon]